MPDRRMLARDPDRFIAITRYLACLDEHLAARHTDEQAMDDTARRMHDSCRADILPLTSTPNPDWPSRDTPCP